MGGMFAGLVKQEKSGGGTWFHGIARRGGGSRLLQDDGDFPGEETQGMTRSTGVVMFHVGSPKHLSST